MTPSKISLRQLVKRKPGMEVKFFCTTSNCTINETKEIPDLSDALNNYPFYFYGLDEGNAEQMIQHVLDEQKEWVEEMIKDDSIFDECDYIFEVTVKKLAVVKTFVKKEIVNEVER